MVGDPRISKVTRLHSFPNRGLTGRIQMSHVINDLCMCTLVIRVTTPMSWFVLCKETQEDGIFLISSFRYLDPSFYIVSYFYNYLHNII